MPNAIALSVTTPGKAQRSYIAASNCLVRQAQDLLIRLNLRRTPDSPAPNERALHGQPVLAERGAGGADYAVFPEEPWRAACGRPL